MKTGSHPLVRELLEQCRFPAPGAPARCGISGGADSTALVALARAAGCAVTAVHVDHGLRDTRADREAVAASCALLEVPLEVVARPVEPGPNLEARAREVRYEALGPGALVGHTADDRAETVILHLLRGGGIDALAPMDTRTRPLIGLRRSHTAALCTQLDLPIVHDPTNDDPRFLRNRVRHEVLPLLSKLAHRDVAGLLARQAELVADDVELLDLLATELDPTDAASLARAPRALARRAVRRWLQPVMPGGYVPDAAAVERVLNVAAGSAVATDVGGGVRVARRSGRLRWEPTGVRPGSET